LLFFLMSILHGQDKIHVVCGAGLYVC